MKQTILFSLLMISFLAVAHAEDEDVIKELEDSQTTSQSPTAVQAEPAKSKATVVKGSPLPSDYSFLADFDPTDESAYPMNFDFLKSGAKLLPQKFIYAISKSGLLIGPVSFLERHIDFKVLTRGSNKDFQFTWPDHLPKQGKIFIMGSGEKEILWQESFTKRDIGNDVKYYRRVSKKNKVSSYNRWTEKGVSTKLLNKIKDQQQFRICYVFEGDAYFLQFCTASYKLDESFKEQRLPPTDVQVIINSVTTKQRGIIILGGEVDKIDFKATLPKGSFVQFTTQPIVFEIVDAVKGPNKSIVIKARGATPYTDNIKWVQEDLWQAEIKNLKFYVGGEGEIPFYQEIFLSEEAPTNEDRLSLHKRVRHNTYANELTVYGYAPEAADLQNLDGEVAKYDKKYFVWKMKDFKKGKFNKKDVRVKYGDKMYAASYDVYRQYQLEISARISGVALVDTKQVLFIGDLILGSWYESFFGWKNYWLGHQRWGLYLKHFRSLMTTPDLTTFAATSLDLKYRLTPGVWEKDATFGLIAGYQTVTFNQSELPMYGAGIFWARSMPELFDKVLNIIPWFRYPKWVDAEFVNYISSADGKYNLGTNYLLNFHGKMLFTSRLFLEGGFSMRQLAFQPVGAAQTPTTAALFTGTLGLGYNF